MATADDVIERANALRDALQGLLNGGLPSPWDEIVTGLRDALISAIETFSEQHPGNESSPAFQHLIDLLNAAIAVARRATLPALETATNKALAAFG